MWLSVCGWDCLAARCLLAQTAGHLTFTTQQTLCLVHWQPAWLTGTLPGEVCTWISMCVWACACVSVCVLMCWCTEKNMLVNLNVSMRVYRAYLVASAFLCVCVCKCASEIGEASFRVCVGGFVCGFNRRGERKDGTEWVRKEDYSCIMKLAPC